MLIVIGLKSKPALLIIELHTVPKKNPNFISMMSMQCMPMEQKNMICRKIFLLYDITPVSMNKPSFLLHIHLYYGKRLRKMFIGFHSRLSSFAPLETPWAS